MIYALENWVDWGLIEVSFDAQLCVANRLKVILY